MNEIDDQTATSTQMPSVQTSENASHPREKLVSQAALIIIDVQQTFDRAEYWGRRNNSEAEKNIQWLVESWQERGLPIVMVTHTSDRIESTFHPQHATSKLKPFLADVVPTIKITKTVNSAFYGTPDLARWLTGQNMDRIVLCGIQTNMCVETTARMAGNLGFKTQVAIDACHTFELKGDDGLMISAEQLTQVTAANLSEGEFASVESTASIIGRLRTETRKAAALASLDFYCTRQTGSASAC
ncbi:isochorismatase family protein [Glutamicibacter arilaitensis]|uniref:isochorismatase family protein n=1 Tax=Glutamicibacter arilaitensis TaxID=256701 RepID=UPI00384C6D85